MSSVLAQSLQDFEIIISDDGSMDDTPVYVRGLTAQDTRIKYIRSEVPMGACAARNLAIDATQAEFITGLDDDDEFEPNRLEQLLGAWDDRYAFVCANFTHHFGGASKGRVNFRLKANTVFTLRDLLRANEASNQMLTRTERLQSIGGFHVKALRLQDWDTWIRLSQHHGPFLRLGMPLYRMHHDHTMASNRVSRSMSLHEALTQMLARNADIYDQHPQEKKQIQRQIALLKGKYRVGAAIRESIEDKTFEPLMDFIRLKGRLLAVATGLRNQIHAGI